MSDADKKKSKKEKKDLPVEDVAMETEDASPASEVEPSIAAIASPLAVRHDQHAAHLTRRHDTRQTSAHAPESMRVRR